MDERTADAETAGAPRGQAAVERRRIGAYEILRELGSGGMGTVFLAVRADEQYRQQVALKLVRGGIAGEEAQRRFRRERQILATLEHPNIARLLDGGATEDGVPYLVMEHVEGEPIDRYCARAALSTAERLRLFRTVCAAVQYAHQKLVVHRDLKPANILVAAGGTPKLLDFGIAKLVDPGPAEEAPLTGTGLVLTPEYASPEQVRGQPVSTATDVYSLGVVLYEILTGRRPYRLATRTPIDVYRAVCEEEPAPPSSAVGEPPTADPEAATVRTLEGTLPTGGDASQRRRRRALQGDLDNIVMKALRKDPQDRYRSVEAFAEDVRRHLEGLPVEARKATLAYRCSKFVARHRVGVAAGVLLAVLGAAFAATVTLQSVRLARERDKATRERDRAERVSAFLTELFRVSDPAQARGRQMSAQDLLDRGAAKLATEFRDAPEMRAALLGTVGGVYNGLGAPEKAGPLLEEALRIRRERLGDHADTARSLSELAFQRSESGDLDGAEALYRETLAMRRRVLPADHPDLAEAMNDLGSTLADKGGLEEARALYREALGLLGEGQEDDPPKLRSEILMNLGFLAYQQGDFAAAERLYREALGIQRASLGGDHPLVTASLNNLAHALSQQGRFAEAEPLFREALALERRVLGPEHPDVARGLRNLGSVLYQKGQDEEAVALYREALALRRRILAPGHPDIGRSLVGLAAALAESDPGESEALLREALAMDARLPGPVRGEARLALARALLARGRAERAEAQARAGMELLRQAHAETHWTVADARSILAACLAARGRLAEAEPMARAAHDALQARLGGRRRESRRARELLQRLERARGGAAAG